MNNRPIVYLTTIILLLMFLTIVIHQSEEFNTKKYNLKYTNLPDAFDGFKIVQLSDLHSNEYGSHNEELIRAIDKQSPDIIVMTGDMISSSDKSYDVFISLAEKLSEKYTIYYIIGNHEERIPKSKLNYIYTNLKSLGITILDNKKVTITKNNQNIDVYGLWYSLKYYNSQDSLSINKNSREYSFNLDVMNNILNERDINNFSILLTHNPMYFETYAKWGADLTLCGHTHGGMIRLPFLGGVFSPEAVLFPKYDAGLFNINTKKMIISRGIGTGIGFRIFNPPELVVITLHKKTVKE